MANATGVTAGTQDFSSDAVLVVQEALAHGRPPATTSRRVISVS